MRQRRRKLIGTVILIIFLPIYALVAMVIGQARLPGTSTLIQTIYFAVAGLLWVVPAALLIGWMQRPDRPPPGAAPQAFGALRPQDRRR